MTLDKVFDEAERGIGEITESVLLLRARQQRLMAQSHYRHAQSQGIEYHGWIAQGDHCMEKAMELELQTQQIKAKG